MIPMPPVRYTKDVKQIIPHEQENIGALNKTFDIILNETSKNYGHAMRSVHAKAHGILVGEMVVDDNLPPELAQGLFAKAGRHKIYMRLSTNAGDLLPDTISLPRGSALKVLDAAGERLPGADGTNQDFVIRASFNKCPFHESSATDKLQTYDEQARRAVAKG